MMQKTLQTFGIQTTFVEQTQNEEFEKAIKENTKLIYVETPANPTLTVTDLTFISNLCKTHNIISVCDNTFATPYNQKPISFGIDIVIHSATKYLGGHSDVVAGAVVSSKQIIESLWPTYISLGAVLHPQEGKLKDISNYRFFSFL